LSLCHPQNGTVSCGSCCGLFNLKLDVNGYKKLLLERTNLFSRTVDFTKRHTIAAFRQSREQIESEIAKQDEMTYNCPYLGYVEEKKTKIGCMIHPIFTGDPKSQNFSFYGTSICQAYDCKNKEHLVSDRIESLFQKVAKDSIEYSHLAADHILVFAIESWLVHKGWSFSEGLSLFENLIIEIFQSRIHVLEKRNPTSFEIRYSQFATEQEIYEYLDEALCEEKKDKILEEMKKAPARE
jgi:hypothetical protein